MEAFVARKDLVEMVDIIVVGRAGVAAGVSQQRVGLFCLMVYHKAIIGIKALVITVNTVPQHVFRNKCETCLLYTSDAADE